jgi:hypothetical protein
VATLASALALTLIGCSGHPAAAKPPTAYPPSHATDHRVATTCGTAEPANHEVHPPITEAYLDSFAMRAKRVVPAAMVGGAWVAGPPGGRRRLRFFATDPKPVQEILSRVPKVDCYRVSLYVVPYSMPHLEALHHRLVGEFARAHVVLASDWADQETDRLEIEVPTAASVHCPFGGSALTVAHPTANYERVREIVAPHAPQVVVRGAKPQCFAPLDGSIEGAN